MNNAAKPHIVHESETQRQHARLPLPVRAEIAGHIYKAKNLSSGGMSLQGVEDNFRPGQRVEASIQMPFENFSLDIAAEAEVMYYESSAKTLGLRFIALNHEQVSLLNYAIKAFMAGDFVDAHDIINIARRDNSARARKAAANSAPESYTKQIIGLVLAVAVGLTAAIFIGRNIYDGMFLIHADDAAVSGSFIDMRAQSSGLVHLALDPSTMLVRPGQAIASITPGAGTDVGPAAGSTITSPCDCYIVTTYRNEGEYAASGEKLFSLIPVKSAPWVVAEVDPTKAARISIKQQAGIVIAGSRLTFTGMVSDIKSGMNDAPAEGQPANAAAFPHPVRIKITPDHVIPADLAGRPARVIFRAR